jgi:beta-glucosidase-like glycosyl hydrolase
MNSSSNVDDRTQHEIYLVPFIRSVMAGVASVMCSYNQVNGTWACEDSTSLNQILKSELGFQGFVQSDWGGTHSTFAAAEGLDMTMPGDMLLDPIGTSNGTYFGSNLTAAVEAGSISEERVENMAIRTIAAWYLLGQDSDFPDVNFDAWDILNEATNQHVDVMADHDLVVREIGAAGAILLKNDGVLPLKKPRTMAVIGSSSLTHVFFQS